MNFIQSFLFAHEEQNAHCRVDVSVASFRHQKLMANRLIAVRQEQIQFVDR
ncbi:hypothetical protein O9929_24170 [Vibrio lentus]|nr:hypothetical protein [Vibrio lentus]